MAEDTKQTKVGNRKAYVKPELERMNEKIPVVVGVPGAPAAAQASPIAPGATVF